jgi:hypothetical protein
VEGEGVNAVEREGSNGGSPDVPSPHRWCPGHSPQAFEVAKGVGETRQDENMARKFVGTDGIRGRTNQNPMTAEMAQRVGQARGRSFLRGRPPPPRGHRQGHAPVGYMMESR